MSSDITLEAATPTGLDPVWTEPCIQQDFVAWRKNRSRYAVWAIDLDTPDLRAACTRMQQHLADYFLPDYERQPHITVRICGFPGPGNGFDDDYTPDLFKAQITTLAAAQIKPFTLSIGTPESFTSAAYFSVHDREGSITCIRKALGHDGPGEKNFPYVPHISFGLYRDQFSLAEVLQRMQSCAGPMKMEFAVKQLVLMSYEAAVIAGPLRAVCAFDFERQSLRLMDTEAMDALRS